MVDLLPKLYGQISLNQRESGDWSIQLGYDRDIELSHQEFIELLRRAGITPEVLTETPAPAVFRTFDDEPEPSVLPVVPPRNGFTWSPQGEIKYWKDGAPSTAQDVQSLLDGSVQFGAFGDARGVKIWGVPAEDLR